MTVAAATTPATKGSTAAVVLAVLAALGPVVMIFLYLAIGPQAPDSADSKLELMATVLAFLYEAVLCPAFAVVALVLALVNRRRARASRRNSGIALMLLGIGVSLFVLQVLLFLPH